jgi:hypothetical protein
MFRRKATLPSSGWKSTEQESSLQQVAWQILHCGFFLGSFFTLKLELIRSSGTSVHMGLHGAISHEVVVALQLFYYLLLLFPFMYLKAVIQPFAALLCLASIFHRLFKEYAVICL